MCFLHFGKPTDDVPLDQAIDKIVENLGNLQLRPAAAADEENGGGDSAETKPKSPTSDVTPLKLKIEVVQRASPLDAVAASGAVADAVAEVVAVATPEARIQSIEVSAV